MNECGKTNCGYYWQEEWEDHPTCHYNDPWPAPCKDTDYDCDYEEEVEFPDDEFGDCDSYDLEVGFNPYDGAYDFDC